MQKVATHKRKNKIDINTNFIAPPFYFFFLSLSAPLMLIIHSDTNTFWHYPKYKKGIRDQRNDNE